MGGESDHAKVDSTRLHKVNQKRQNKAVTWLMDPMTRGSLLLWLLISCKILHMHYMLFRDAKVGVRAFPQCEGATPDSERAKANVVFNLCNPARSRAREVLNTLAEMLLPQCPQHRGHWSIMNKLYGEHSWPAALLRKARAALLIEIGNVWRRPRPEKPRGRTRTCCQPDGFAFDSVRHSRL